MYSVFEQFIGYLTEFGDEDEGGFKFILFLWFELV
jgi:hypothetical protein